MNRKETTEFLGRLLKKRGSEELGSIGRVKSALIHGPQKVKGNEWTTCSLSRTINVLYQHWKKGFSYATR